MRRIFASVLTVSCLAFSLRSQPVALTVNPASREEVRQFYRAIFHASENVPIQWTGNYAAGNVGDTSAAFKEATRLRINFFRALVGVSANITFNPVFSTKAQQAALMMSANNTLDHFPPASWTSFTAAGAEGAAASNLAIGQAGPDAISGYIADAGANNAAVGHRRWLFYPQTLQMGTGDVAGIVGDNSRRPANAIWILDTGPGQFGSPRPITRAPAVAYPPAGYVPYGIVWPRWSFSFPGAEFSGTTVTMTRNGQSIAVAPEPLSGTPAGEPTIVWAYDGRDTNLELPHARPASDTTYTVNVNNVRVGGTPQNFSYTVIVFDPDVPGPDVAPVSVAGNSAPAVGSPTAYVVTKPSFAGTFDWRPLQLATFAKTFTAESGLDGLIATVTPGYNVVQSSSVAAGTSAFRLAHLSPRSSQILLFPDRYRVVGSESAVSFRSRLGIATAIQTARVEVSTDEGVSWIELFRQSGTSDANSPQPQPTEPGFVTRNVSLSSYVGRVVSVRLVFTINPSGTAFLPEPSNGVGWFIDNLTLTQVQTANAGAATRVAAGNTFSFSPTAVGPVALQARGVLFGAYALEWGSVSPLNPVGSGAASDPGRLINLSILTALTPSEDVFTMGYVVGGAGTDGNKPILIRAVGPSLVPIGVADVLDDPKLELFAGETKSGDSDNWGGSTQLSDAMARVGAFAFTSVISRDAAALASIATANNSVRISSANMGIGTVLAELYDSTPAADFRTSTPRLVNVSVLKHLGEGLTVGFVLGGSTPTTVLVRAIGPTLGTPLFGLDGVVADPQLTLFLDSTTVGTNDNWDGTAALTAAFARVAAFDLPAASRDAALVTTLQPGNYTVTVTGVGNTSGIAIVEVYEVPAL